jgi:hypothetical protein
VAAEVLANLSQGTVTSGGTTAPAAGTVETWTVNVSTAFPAVSTGAVTQFHASDPASPSELVLVTAAPGGTGSQSWTVTRGAEGTAPVAHQAGFTAEGVITAGGTAQLKVTEWLNVKTVFGAAGNGTTDDTAAVQSAVSLAETAGGGVYVPPGTYKIMSPLAVTAPFTLLGAGQAATTFAVASGVNDYLVKFTQGSGAITRARFADFTISGNAANQSAGGGISAVGAVNCFFERIHFTSCFNWGLALQAIPGGAFGHHNKITACSFDNAANAGFGGGGWATSSDENFWTECDFQYLGGAAAPVGSYPVMLLDQAGLQHIENCVFVGSRGSNTDVIGYRAQSASQSKILGCTFDGVGGDNVFINGTDCLIEGCTMTSVADQAATAGWGAGVHLEFGTARNVVTGNNVSSSATNGKTGYLIREESTGGAGANLIEGNTLRVSGTVAVAKLVSQGAASAVRGNVNYNPVGSITGAGIVLPGSGTPLGNPGNVDCEAWITCGGGVTVSAVTVNGGTIPVTVAAGTTSPAIFVPAGGAGIAVTYAGGTPALTVNGC